MSATRKTTKTARKSTTGRTTSRTTRTTSARKAGTSAVLATPVGGEFSTTPTEQLVRQVPAGHILLFVNGREQGTVDVRNKTIGAFVKETAENKGMRSFSVYADGEKLKVSKANSTFAGVQKLELVAKDSRG